MIIQQTLDTVYNNIVSAHKIATENKIPRKVRKTAYVPWENDNIKLKRLELSEAFKVVTERETTENKNRLKKAKKALNDAYDKAQKDYVREKTDDIINATEQQKSRLVWMTVNEITGRKKTNQGKIKANTSEERIAKWKEHFSSLLGQPPKISESPTILVNDDILPIETADFTRDELIKCINTFSNNKAPGLDNIPIEVWKTDAITEPLLDVCNKTLNGDKASIWVRSGIVPFPKKGDLGNTENYRGISLTVTSAKIYNKMLLHRIRPHIEPLLRINQNGFRPKRSTTAQILTIRRLLEGIKEKNLPAILTFVDFKKAFDSIHRGKLMQILTSYGIPDKIVKAINILYQHTEAQVISPDGDTDFFEMVAGVLQGDTLAPFLFIIALDYAMRIATKDETTGFTLAKRRSTRHPTKTITDTDFADDIALLSNLVEEGQLLLLRVESAAAQVGLHVNQKKTEYIVKNQPEGNLITLNGGTLKEVEDFLYLGSWIGSTEKDMGTRIGKSWVALNKMNTIWKSNLSKNIKIGFFQATVESILLYGAETWTLTRKLEKRLDGVYTKLLRAALNISWKAHVTNKNLYGNLTPITVVLRQRRLRFIGHCWRSKAEVIQRLILWEPQHGNRKRGRPKITYIDQLERDTGIMRGNLGRAMEDRILLLISCKKHKKCILRKFPIFTHLMPIFLH